MNTRKFLEFMEKIEMARVISFRKSMPELLKIVSLKTSGKISEQQQHKLAVAVGERSMTQALREVGLL